MNLPGVSHISWCNSGCYLSTFEHLGQWLWCDRSTGRGLDGILAQTEGPFWIDGSTVKMNETKDLPKLFQKAGWGQLESILSVCLLMSFGVPGS